MKPGREDRRRRGRIPAMASCAARSARRALARSGRSRSNGIRATIRSNGASRTRSARESRGGSTTAGRRPGTRSARMAGGEGEPMNPFVSDDERTREGDLADWQAFSLAYYEPIRRALRLLRAPEGELEDLAHSFLIKAAERDFLATFRAFRQRQLEDGRRVRFRTYLYRSIQNHVRDLYRTTGPGAGSRPGFRRSPDDRRRSGDDARPRRHLRPRRAPSGDPGAATALRTERQAALLGLLRGIVPGR